MVHSHCNVWVHFVWATKYRQKVLFKNEASQLFSFFVTKSEELGFRIDKMNIQPEHVHLLIKLNSDLSISETARKLKGSSSYWLNKNYFSDQFKWQRGYGAFSVSASQIENVKRYIKNQFEHHNKKSFEEEYELWRKKYVIFED
jgi:REP element-mobilizing transposase RayT